jgi:hypothetical protein
LELGHGHFQISEVEKSLAQQEIRFHVRLNADGFLQVRRGLLVLAVL